MKEEIFGPVGVIIKFKTEAEVIALANDSAYGLSSNIYTRDLDCAIRVTDELEAGSAFVRVLPHVLRITYPRVGEHVQLAMP